MDEILIKYKTDNLDDPIEIKVEMTLYGDTEDELDDYVQDACDEGFLAIGPLFIVRDGKDDPYYGQFMVQI